MSIKVYSYFDRPVDPGISCSIEEGMTKQAYKDECDINVLMRRYEKTGLLPELIQRNPVYGDFSDVMEYQDALNVVAKAKEQFEALDAKVRDRFANDPAKFLEFVSDEGNKAEAAKLGLLKADAVLAPVSSDAVASKAAQTEAK